MADTHEKTGHVEAIFVAETSRDAKVFKQVQAWEALRVLRR
jgi:hypothetical protein